MTFGRRGVDMAYLPYNHFMKPNQLRHLQRSRITVTSPNQLFFQYLQIRHILHSIKWPSKPESELPFGKFLCRSKGFEKGLSLIYKKLFESANITKGANMLKWESELQKSFTLADWTAASQTSFKLCHCINHQGDNV